MKQKLSSFSVILVFICFSIIGAGLLPFLSIQLNSSRQVPSLGVSYSWPDASAKVIEQSATSKLEGVFNEIKGVQYVNSSSQKGSGYIEVGFKDQVNLDAARFEMANQIRQVYPKLPEGLSYPQISMSSPSESSSPILSYSIKADKSPFYIDRYARTNILPKLSDLEGVNNVELYGAAPYEWVITYDADQLVQLQLSSADLRNAISTYLQKNQLGLAQFSFGEGSQEMSLQLAYKTENELDWKRIPIKNVGSRILYLGDLASVKFKEAPVSSYYRINGLNTLNMVIYPKKGVNTIQVADDVKKRVTELKNRISEEYQLTLTQDTSEFLVRELKIIQRRTLISIGALLLLTILIYRDIRYIVILFSGIVVNLLIAAIFYYFLKIELQLYSFAGITVSFGIIIDNTVIMMDHVRKKGDKKAFLAILASTLTTIGAVMIIFFLGEDQRMNLLDFAYVIIINLGVSLLVALYFVPAVMDKWKIRPAGKYLRSRKKLRILRFTKGYYSSIMFLKKPYFLGALVVLFVLGFGIPLHLLPTKIEEPKSAWGEFYNNTIGDDTFTSTYRPTLEKILGGSFRLFSQEVFSESYYQEPEQTVLQVTGQMPEGASIEQLNSAILKLEDYLATFEEIELFQTQIRSYRNSRISIYFKEKYESGGFPYLLKSLLEAKVTSLGGMDWSVYGVGRGFSNALNTGSGSNQIALEGYNYDNLYSYAQLLGKQLVQESRGRVKEVEITSGSWNDTAMREFFLEFDPALLALSNTSASALYTTLTTHLHSSTVGQIVNDNELQQVKLISDKVGSFNRWDLENTPFSINDNEYKLAQLASIESRKTGNNIVKNNQQYHLVVAYDFLGPYQLASKFKDSFIEDFTEILPIGYKIFSRQYGLWDRKDSTQYYYILVVVIIIFFICAILLESLLQPLAIISMIPMAFIGAFLSFYLLGINFDQGGYASFILLAGLSVNAALFIINEFNNLVEENPGKPKQRLYFKAFNNKIIPILITIITTIVGLLPFVWGSEREVFWFSFAVGSIGGLLFSLVGLFIYLPLFSLKRAGI